MAQSEWFDLWGVTEADGAWDVGQLGIKVFDSDLLESRLTFGARICGLWIRFLACHHRIHEYSKEQIAEDLNVEAGTVHRWVKELADCGFLDKIDGTWLTDTTVGQIYFIQSKSGGPIKIGKAINAIKRLSQIQTGYPEELVVIGLIESGGLQLEKQLHQRFSTSRLRGEWFLPTPDLIKYIRELPTKRLVAV